MRALRYAIERKQAEEALRDANEVLEERVRGNALPSWKRPTTSCATKSSSASTFKKRLTLAQEAAQINTFEWHIPSDQVNWSATGNPQHPPTKGPEFGVGQWTWTVHPDDLEQVQQELWQTIQDRHGFNTEFRILDGNEVRWLAIKSSLFCDGQGNPERLLGIQMDITDKKQMEEQFFRAQRAESLGTLASGIAHDLNNILTPILLVVQLLPLKLPDVDPSIQTKLDILERSAQRGLIWSSKSSPLPGG